MYIIVNWETYNESFVYSCD